jgi:hypothetical protein
VLRTDSRGTVVPGCECQSELAWNPQDAAAHSSLSIALKKDGQREDAARELRIAQRLNPLSQLFSRASCFYAGYGI